MIMGEFFGLIGWSGGKNRLTRLLIFLLTISLTGCAAQTTVTAPVPPPAPKQVPVRVAKAPRKPVSKEYLRAKVAKARRASRGDILGPERFARAIKKIPTSRRRPKKGEKVYPLDLNLKGADLVEAIRVLADTLGLNYTIDPRVKGTANVRASGKLTETDILGIMETTLLVNNATMVREGNQYKIIPLEKAAHGAMPVDRRGITPVGMSAQVVFPEQTEAKEMVKVLKPLLSPGGSIAEGAHNSLIIIDYPANLEKLLQLVHLIDTQALTQTLVRVVKVDNTDPGEIISELEVIFTAYGTLAKKSKFGVSFMPVPRLNAVMILADSGPLMERALYWTRHLDQRTDMLANVHVYNVENYKARNLADLLTQVYGGTAAAPTVKEKKPETGARGLGSTGFGSSLGRSGTGTQSQTSTGMSSLGTSGSGTGGTGILGSQTGLGAGGMAPALKERAVPLGAGAQQGVSPKEGVRIIPDEENNLLVVVAPPHEWRIISRLLKSLDIMPRQVLNEVLIAEIRLSDELKYGIEFLLGGTPSAVSTSTGTDTGTTSTTGVLVSSSSATTTAPGTIAGVDISGPASAAFTAASGFTFVATDTLNKLKGVINLLASQGKVNILASPHIMAANNQEATIMIGEEVPTLTSQSVPLVSQATSFQTSTVQYRNTGIILSVKPQINANGMVTLEIAQEVSNANTTTTGVSGTPTFTVRQAKTSLITGDNQTVVLGGLIREDKTTTQAGIPGLRKMPILGPLFGSEGVSKQKTELLVLITPHIITNLEEGARVTHEMKEKVGLEEPPPLRREPPKPPEPFHSPY
ncbi:MAG: type II secretion system secretin GspD [Syntrophales bacterium]|nr:type II secretion system secretin GspD [Syntrophales bacterium]